MAKFIGTARWNVYSTRVLSRYSWLMNGKTPALSCSSNVEQYSSLGYFIQPTETCAETPAHDCSPLEETLELRLAREVGEGMEERVAVTNHTQIATPVVLELQFEIDFLAQDEVENGRKQHGNLQLNQHQPQPGIWQLIARYRAHHQYSHEGNVGVAHLDRGLILEIRDASSAPHISNDHVLFQMMIAPHEEWRACLRWTGQVDGKDVPLSTHCQTDSGTDWDKRRSSFLASATSLAFPHSDDLTSTVNRVLRRSMLDMEALRLHDFEPEDDERGNDVAIPVAAGIPTYQEVFGRDMEASSWEAAILSPDFVRGALHVLNKESAQEINDWRDAQPGRLVHEIHTDPLSSLNFRPKSRYFGSASSSMLFPIVVGQLWHWTGDLDEVRRYADTAIRALEWADKYSLDSTHFYRYQSHSEQGVKNQGWKDPTMPSSILTVRK
jgi:hypothetical protein